MDNLYYYLNCLSLFPIHFRENSFFYRYPDSFPCIEHEINRLIILTAVEEDRKEVSGENRKETNGKTV